MLGAGQPCCPTSKNAIYGLKAGEARPSKMTFPADYLSEGSRAKTVSFEITVKEVREPILPEARC